VSQGNKDKADAAETRTQQTRCFMQQVRVASRRKYTPEEKVRIVLEGFRREVTVSELCRREGIMRGLRTSWRLGRSGSPGIPSGMPRARKSMH
jgi:transposase-like protein